MFSLVYPSVPLLRAEDAVFHPVTPMDLIQDHLFCRHLPLNEASPPLPAPKSPVISVRILILEWSWFAWLWGVSEPKQDRLRETRALSPFTDLAATKRSLIEGLKETQGLFISYIREKVQGWMMAPIRSSGTQAPCFLSCHPKCLGFSLQVASWSQDGSSIFSHHIYIPGMEMQKGRRFKRASAYWISPL